MVAKRRRLPKEEFKARGYSTIKTPFFSLKIKSNGRDVGRMGIVSGKTVHKSAVKRNFLKREFSSALEKHVREGEDILAILYPSINTLTKKEIIAEINKVFR